MESLLLLLIPLACPLMMGLFGLGAWLWHKVRDASAKPARAHHAQGGEA